MLTFEGYKSLRWGLDFIRLDVTNAYVYGLDFLRLGFINRYIRGLEFLRLKVRFLTLRVINP